MHTFSARTSQMLTCICLGFAMHSTCTHMQAQKTHIHSHTRAHSCTPVFKFRATERLESPLVGRSKFHATERPNLHYAGFS